MKNDKSVMKNKIWTCVILIIVFVSSVLTLLIQTLFNDNPVVKIVALTGAIVLDTVVLILLAIVVVTTIKSKKTQKSQGEKTFEQAEFFIKTDEDRKFVDVWKNIIVERNGNDLICKNGGGGFSFYLGDSLISFDCNVVTKRVEGFGGCLAADKIKPQKIALPKTVAEGVMYVKTSENLSSGSGRRISFDDNVICDEENGRIVFGDYNDDEITYKVLGNVFVQLTADGALKSILICNFKR